MGRLSRVVKLQILPGNHIALGVALSCADLISPWRLHALHSFSEDGNGEREESKVDVSSWSPAIVGINLQKCQGILALNSWALGGVETIKI